MFSATTLNHFQSPRHLGAMVDADLVGQEGFPGEGPFMKLYLRMDGERIAEASFETYGCPAAMACGSWLTSWLPGKTLEQAMLVEPGDVAAMIGGLPLGKEHCAALAVKALRCAFAVGGLTSRNCAAI